MLRSLPGRLSVVTVAHVRAVIYVRQSLDRTGDGHAVARQEAECLKLCRQRGWSSPEVISDNDMSASTGRIRPGFERMLKLAENGEIDAIVCWHTDRLTRRMVELERVITVCESAGVKLVTVSGDLDLSTDAGRLNARILAAVARAEVERKGTRQKLANEQRARAGLVVNQTFRPFGHTADRSALVQEEADAIRQACHTLLAGGALRGIVRDWTKAGLTTPQGAPGWTPQAVRYILVSPRIAGLSTYKGDVVGDAQWPAIVPQDTWRAVKAILENPSRMTPKGVQTLLSGLALCSCKRPLWAGRSHHGKQVYKCSTYFAGMGHEDCEAGTRHTSRMAEPVNDFIRDLVVARLQQPDARDLLISENTPDAAGMQEKLRTLGGRLEELAAMFADGEINRAQLTSGSAKIRAEIADLESRLADADRVAVLGDLVNADDVLAVWEQIGLDRQRAVVDVLMSVVILAPGKGCRTFRPETVDVQWKS